MSRESSKERNKKIILAVLLLIAVGIAVWNFTKGPDTRRPAPRPQAGSNPPAQPAAPSNPAQDQARATAALQQELTYEQLLADTTPLNLQLISHPGGDASVGKRGNIFAFYVPPPPPPAPTPPPPPITLQMVQPQSAVAGTPRNITLQVTGQGFPPDAQIMIDGTPRQTGRVNDMTLTTQIAANEYAFARNMNVEVKSASDPAKFYSNPIPFIVQPAPEPPFRYIGRIGENGLFEMGGTKEIARKKRGDLIQGVWRIDSITDQAVEVTNTTYEIKKRVAMVEKVR